MILNGVIKMKRPDKHEAKVVNEESGQPFLSRFEMYQEKLLLYQSSGPEHALFTVRCIKGLHNGFMIDSNCF